VRPLREAAQAVGYLRCAFKGAERNGVNFSSVAVLAKALLDVTGLPVLST
jgi:hypothetical protein